MWPMRPIACRFARKQVSARTKGQYPAPLRAIDANGRRAGGEKPRRGTGGRGEDFWRSERDAGMQESHPQIFFLREKYSKLTFDTGRVARSGPISARVVTAPIEKVGVLARG